MDASELRPDATSGGLALDVPKEALLDALTCPISGKLFVDPVTAVCGHTFSRRMLAKWMSQPGRQSSCPTCRAPLYHESPHQWPVNTTIADLCERFLNDALREARDSEPALDFPPFDSQYRAPPRGGALPRAGTRSARDAAHAVARGDDTTRSGNARSGSVAVELPLFVLDPMVPGQEITLNVFEERYKRMVRRCMQHTRRFGMVAPADEHHEGATRAVTTRERRKGETGTRARTPDRRNGAVYDPSADAPDEEDVSARAYASSEEEEDALESSSSDDETHPAETFPPFDPSSRAATRRASRESREARELRHAGRARRGVGRRVDPPAGPFAFLDHGVECVVTAFQEGIDGRVLVRCRATRHVKVLSAFEDEAGYAVARVVQVTDDASSISRDGDIFAPDPRHVRAQARAFPDAATDPSAWRAVLMAAVDAAARKKPGSLTRARERDACRLSLRLERAVGAHRVWLAHVSGRQLEGSSPEGSSGPPDAPNPDSARAAARLPWSRGGAPGGDYFRRSYGGKPENLLALSGERPRADRPEALAWWLARVANPLPPLGAALELRGAALSASGVTRRFSRVHRGLVGSMRSVHGLAFEDFRGARPAAAAAVAVAWCRAVEASARLDARLETEGEPEADLFAGVSLARAPSQPKSAPRATRARRLDESEKDASASRAVDADAYRAAPRARNRHRFQFLVDGALRVFVESVSRYGEMRPDDEEDAGSGTRDARGANGARGASSSWPAMRATPLPGFDPRARGNRGVASEEGDDGFRETPGAGAGRPPRRRDSAAALQTEMRERMAFLVAKGGAPCVAWALYRHLSRFEDATFESLAEGIGWAIDPANREFAFVRLGEADRAHYASYDVIDKIPFFPADFAGSVPDDFPRPGDAARARAKVGVAPAAKRAAFSSARGGGGGRFLATRSSRAVAGALFVAVPALTHRLLAVAVMAFAWTVAGIGHLLVIAFLALRVPLLRALGTVSGFSFRPSAPLRRADPGPARELAANRFGVGVADLSFREGAGGSSRDRNRLVSGAFALASAAALYLVLDSDAESAGARG